MTEKTDISPLKDHNIREFVNELRDVASKYADAQCMRDVLSRIVHKHVGGLTATLEAERQRTEKAELELIKPLPIGELIQRLEGQTYEKWFSQSDLKGEQVPVALIDERTVLGFMLTKRGRELNMPHGTELFTIPQNPVGLPEPISISDVILKVDAEQNAKWNGRIGFMAGWNACRDAAGSVAKESK